ncbi:thermonuclease family protein [Flavobacterium psychrotrophum]|uniref:thermonuclease family protein n=1 Tax=Flavobacterium psychrotrophum TaxID=2294119 RepID=UPI000E30DB5B|nr:thermonuclease family protein [Flavobacterium psychrotrophum]
MVTVTSTGRDRYGRVVGTITTQDGTNVNEELVKAGFAWHYKQYSNNEQIGVFENRAREQHLGLWADKNPTAPWEYRRNRRKK